MIHYLIYVDSHGGIRMIKPAKGANNPAEGMNEETGFTIIWYMEPLADAGNFMSTTYWSYSTETWLNRDARPNRHASWAWEAWSWDSDLLLDDIRKERNKRIFQSDWTVILDSPLTDAEQTEARTYRTALRDLPATLDMSTISSVDEVTWPTPPSFLG